MLCDSWQAAANPMDQDMNNLAEVQEALLHAGGDEIDDHIQLGRPAASAVRAGPAAEATVRPGQVLVKPRSFPCNTQAQGSNQAGLHSLRFASRRTAFLPSLGPRAPRKRPATGPSPSGRRCSCQSAAAAPTKGVQTPPTAPSSHDHSRSLPVGSAWSWDANWRTGNAHPFFFDTHLSLMFP
jgi:hypothetical protein